MAIFKHVTGHMNRFCFRGQAKLKNVRRRRRFALFAIEGQHRHPPVCFSQYGGDRLALQWPDDLIGAVGQRLSILAQRRRARLTGIINA